MKPNNFPLRPSLDGSEELYTQTANVSQKFTLEEAKKYANAIEVTYAKLIEDLIPNQALIAGSHYIITDFRTCYNRPDYDQFKNSISVYSGSTYIQAAIEPIIVMATGVDTLAPDAYQPEYPNDKIKYDVTYSKIESEDKAFGRITERVDNYNNRTDYDHRTIEFKRYRFYYFSRETPETGTMELLNDGTVNGFGTFFTALTTGDVIAYPNSIEGFFRIDSISSDTLMLVSGLSINSFGGSGEFYIANAGSYDSYYRSNVDDPTDFNLYTTFGNAIGDGVINNYIGDYSNLYIEDNEGDFLLANNVFKDGEYNNNNIGNGFYNNTFNDDCNNNKIGNYCYNNITNNDFDGNVIGNFFTNNLITADFQYNHVGQDFTNNTIINTDFRNNRIGNDFTNNWIDIGSGFDFDRNQIGDLFESNTIFRDFQDNTIGNGFNGNEIYQTFYDNDISNDFNNNTIGDFEDIGAGNFEDNLIGNTFKGNSTFGQFTYNQIGNDFISNATEDGFTYNVIGNNTFSNDIGINFGYNQIGNLFNNNTIGDSFNNNTIANNFSDNNIGDSFNNNTIANEFDNNDIQNGFNNNTIGNSFLNNTIDINCNNNTIGNSSQGNTIGSLFSDNAIGNGFQSNTIGINFLLNTIGNTFASNTIGGSFQSNIIGDTFNLNVIGNNFFANNIRNINTFNSNTIGNLFQSNLIDYSIGSTNFSAATHVYADYTCTIFKRSDGALQLSYIDGTNTIQYTTINA
jgi:hypothetical protein